MAATLSMPPARTDPTAQAAIARVARTERPAGLWVSIQDRVGDQLIEAFLRCANARFTGR